MAVHKRQKGRSPAYPAISLDLAIDRARAIYKAERRHPAPISVIQNHWGMKAGSGTANVAVAALKRFGLLSDDGQGQRRTARLTDLAVELLLSGSSDQTNHDRELVQKAALLPAIHQEIWDQYQGSLPSDATLLRELVMVRNFTESGAKDFIGQFRKTLAFAGLDVEAPSGRSFQAHENLSEDRQEREEGLSTMQSSPASEPQVVPDPESPAPSVPHPQPQASSLTVSHPRPTPASDQRTVGSVTIPILLPGVPPVHLTGEFPITEAAWKQLMVVLEAMKGGLVAE